MNDIHKLWVQHLGGYMPRYPREVCGETGGFFNRVECINTGHYISQIEKMAKSGNTWVAIQSVPQYTNGVWDKIYIDIDSGDLDLSHEYMFKTVDYIQDRYGAKPRVYFTGKKGYALYIDIEPTDLHASQLRPWVRDLGKRLNVIYDNKVIGDARRISRMPYTYHSGTLSNKGFRMCVPVNHEWSLDKVINESYHPSFKDIVIDTQNDVAESIQAIKVKEYIDIPRSQESIPDININGLVEIATKIDDYRSRIMFDTLIPHCVQTGMTDEQAESTCFMFIEESGDRPHEYRAYIRRSIKWHRNRTNFKIKTIEDMVMDDPTILAEL